MRTRLLSILLASATVNASAQLAPTTLAPLSAHLTEVNKEWRTMDPTPAGGDRLVRFDGEAQRIAMHLRMVRERLLAHAPEGVSATQMHARTQLLDRLGDYAARGSFPQNSMLPYRNPVFIDQLGTACAVGQLMIESGDRSLAERISNDINLAYVHDMHRTDVDAWAVAHGFNEDELAWIQPTYAPTNDWYPLGGGTNGEVTALLTLANGDLIVAGSFTEAGGTSCTSVVRWDPDTYTYFTMGSGVDGSVSCAVEFDGDIYLGGSFNAGYQDLAIWDGVSWTYQNAFVGKYVMVNDLHVFSGSLFAAGYASGFAGNTHQVLGLYGGNWQPLGNPFNNEVLTLQDHYGSLVCGGAFTQGAGPLDPVLSHVAVYGSANWGQLADGLDATVYDLHAFNGELFAGGEMRVDSLPMFGFARLGSGAPAWELLMPNQLGYIDYFDGTCRVEAITDDGTAVFIAGAFDLFGMMTFGTNVAHWSNFPDAFEALANTDGAVHTLATLSSLPHLIMGGVFQNNNSVAVPFVGYTDLQAGIGESSDHLAFSISPNPTTDQLLIALAETHTTNTVSVIDANGREVIAPLPVNGREVRVDVRSLAAGHYLARLSTPKGARTLPFVKR